VRCGNDHPFATTCSLVISVVYLIYGPIIVIGFVDDMLIQIMCLILVFYSRPNCVQILVES